MPFCSRFVPINGKNYLDGGIADSIPVRKALTMGFDTIVDNLLYWKKSYISSYEKSKNAAQRGNIKLTDTQEIQLPEKYRYNTPPIDGRVKKHRKPKKRKGGKNDE